MPGHPETMVKFGSRCLTWNATVAVEPGNVWGFFVVFLFFLLYDASHNLTVHRVTVNKSHVTQNVLSTVPETSSVLHKCWVFTLI